MMIHSVSYEAGQRDSSTPTLNDGNDWLDVLKQGLIIKMGWTDDYNYEMKSILKILQHPQNTLPSFNKDSLSKLESTMQENLFRLINNTCYSMVDSSLPQFELKFDRINQD